MEWKNSSQNRDNRRSLKDTAVNLRFLKKQENSGQSYCVIPSLDDSVPESSNMGCMYCFLMRGGTSEPNYI
jgi:protein-tyrosine phosphatase